MSYIGKEPTIGNFQVCDAISVVNNQAAYTMQVGGVNVSPQSAQHMLVSLNGILQAPTTSFTVSNSVITFASNLVTNDVIDFIQILGNVLDLGVPSDNTVTTAKLADSSVSLAKLTATGTKNSTTFLRGDNTFNAPPLGGITNAQNWRITSNQSGSQEPISSGWEETDSDGYNRLGDAMTQSSGIFTFPATGYWLIIFQWSNEAGSGSSNYNTGVIQTATNGSTFGSASEGYTNLFSSSAYNSSTVNWVFDVTNVSTHKVRFSTGVQDSSTVLQGDTNNSRTAATFIRLGDT